MKKWFSQTKVGKWFRTGSHSMSRDHVFGDGRKQLHVNDLMYRIVWERTEQVRSLERLVWGSRQVAFA